MRLGWLGYNSLRRDLLAPINNTDLFITAIPDLAKWTGNLVHWMPMKRLAEGCHLPPPGAESDELLAHQSVIHYQDSLKPLMQYVNSAPVKGRHQWLHEHPFDWRQVRFEIPTLDIAIIEASAQIGASYGVNELLKQLWRKNPNIGFVVIDLDLAGTTTFSKMKKWHPNWQERTIFVSYHPQRRHEHQAFLCITHPENRIREPWNYGDQWCYVGNDYFRREAMLRLLSGDRCHLYGRVKEDFEPAIRAAGVVLHGPFIPSPTYSIEDVYRQHGFGINLAREDYYKLNLVTCRISEVTRAGVLLFSDYRLQIAKPMLGEWFMVQNAADLEARVNYVQQNRQFWLDSIVAQQNAVAHYVSSRRYSETLFICASTLNQGPLRSQWRLSLYDDLLKAAGLSPWMS